LAAIGGLVTGLGVGFFAESWPEALLSSAFNAFNMSVFR
jgi:hypothetical protein